jgi:hypothetical protein
MERFQRNAVLPVSMTAEASVWTPGKASNFLDETIIFNNFNPFELRMGCVAFHLQNTCTLS